MTLFIVTVIAVLMLTGGVVGARLLSAHRILGFFLGAFVALVFCDIAVRLLIGKSLSMHVKTLVDRIKSGKLTIPKSQP
jgi:hypothetical protein